MCHLFRFSQVIPGRNFFSNSFISSHSVKPTKCSHLLPLFPPLRLPLMAVDILLLRRPCTVDLAFLVYLTECSLHLSLLFSLHLDATARYFSGLARRLNRDSSLSLSGSARRACFMASYLHLLHHECNPSGVFLSMPKYLTLFLLPHFLHLFLFSVGGLTLLMGIRYYPWVNLSSRVSSRVELGMGAGICKLLILAGDSGLEPETFGFGV